MNKVKFYKTNSNRDEKSQKEYENERIKALLDDPDRKNAQYHDDGSRRNRQEVLNAQNPASNYDFSLGKLIRLGAWTIGLGALAIAGVKYINSEFDKPFYDYQNKKDQERIKHLEKNAPELLETWNGWSEESGKSRPEKTIDNYERPQATIDNWEK